jgi:hypothetical protein
MLTLPLLSRLLVDVLVSRSVVLVRILNVSVPSVTPPLLLKDETVLITSCSKLHLKKPGSRKNT